MSALPQLQDAGFRVVLCDEHVTVARYHHVVAMVVRGDSDVAAVERSAVLCEEIRKEGGRIGVLTVTTPSARMPSAGARSAIKGLNAEYADSFLASVTVFLGEGLLRTGLRAVARAMALSMKGDFPREVYGDVESAARMLTEGSAADPVTLARALHRCAKRSGDCCGA